MGDPVTELRLRAEEALPGAIQAALAGADPAVPPRGRAPVLGFLAFTSGALEGAILRDIALANTLHRRGFKVVVYWMMERLPGRLDPGIRQHVLLRALRYLTPRPSAVLEGASRIFDIVGHRGRRNFTFRRPRLIAHLLHNFLVDASRPAPDQGLVRRLERALAADGVTHLLPTHAMTCPLARAAKARGRHGFDYLVTFQGEEIFANFLEEGRQTQAYFQELRRAADASAWPAIAVSRDYARRLQEELGLTPKRLVTIYPGVEPPAPPSSRPARELLQEAMPWLDRELPVVAYFGRQDAEKGIDLLLYASRLLQERGLAHQLVIGGSSSFGKGYEDACKMIARNLRLSVSWHRQIEEGLRATLYRASRCIVYPSIHREPFGMVVPEAMAHGTPVVVPDQGGVVEAIGTGPAAGGLTFRAWDSQDLADQIGRLLQDDTLHAALAARGPAIAAQFSIDAMADSVLAHMGLPPRKTAG